MTQAEPIHQNTHPLFLRLWVISHLCISVFQGVCLYFISQITCHINMVVFSLSILFSLSVTQAPARQRSAAGGPGLSFIHPLAHLAPQCFLSQHWSGRPAFSCRHCKCIGSGHEKCSGVDGQGRVSVCLYGCAHMNECVSVCDYLLQGISP